MKKSTEINTKSPMSLTGFSQRWLRATRAESPFGTVLLFVPRWLIWILGIVVLAVWNLIVWGVFFWFTLPWRAYRNSARRDKRRAAEHAELMDALKKENS